MTIAGWFIGLAYYNGFVRLPLMFNGGRISCSNIGMAAFPIIIGWTSLLSWL